MSSNKKVVLVVDDTSENIDVLTGILSSEYTVKAAVNGERALKIATSENRPDLILLDIMMPEMDGYEVCRRLKADEKTKAIPVIFVTAKGEVSDETLGFEVGAIDYITKPVSPPIVRARVNNIFTLQQSQKELQESLDETLTGSVELMMDILSLINPTAFGRGRNLRRHVRATAKRLGHQNSWTFELAAMLSQLGCVTVPEEILEKIYSDEAVTDEERAMFDTHPAVGKRLLENIPKLEEVAEIIALQNTPVKGMKDEIESESRIRLGASLLQVALHMDDLDRKREASSHAVAQKEAELKENREREVRLQGLQVGMMLNNDVTTLKGMMLMKAGTELTRAAIERLRGFESSSTLRTKVFKVIMPEKD